MDFGKTDNNFKFKKLEPVWAYALLGWLLGTFPPIALFTVVSLTQAYTQNSKRETLLGLFLVIVLICSVIGLGVGAFIGLLMKFARLAHWLVPLGLAPFLGALWAIITGGAGGFPFYVFGAFAGMIYAAPVGILGFSIFAVVYELLNRRRTVSQRQLIFSVVATSVFILSGFVVWLFWTET